MLRETLRDMPAGTQGRVVYAVDSRVGVEIGDRLIDAHHTAFAFAQEKAA
jgi:hypothetical protein